MSAAAALYRRGKGPVDEDAFRRVFGALDDRGPDGGDVVATGTVRIGHRHFWTTPEEVGERQPLEDVEGRRIVAFEGRLDNRRDLLPRLPEVEPGASDATVILAAWKRWGESFLEELVGPFALILFDPWSRSLLCARDPLGQRSLFYAETPESYLVASEETALLAHPDVSSRLDEESVARYFARRGPRSGRTFYRDVRELRPGSLLRIDGDRLRIRSYWEPEPWPESSPRRKDEEWAAELRATLETSVESRLRSRGVPWVLLSGGLDSASVASVGAELRRVRGERPLRAVSWIFDELPECDESKRIRAVVTRSGVQWFPLRADDSPPLADPSAWPLDPARAFSDPFGWTVDRAYRKVRENGGRVLLTGYWGNHLYTGGGSWMTSLLRQGRFLEAGRALGEWLGSEGRGPASLARRGVSALGLGVDGRPDDPWSPWLTDRSRDLSGPAAGDRDPGSGECWRDPELVWAAPARWRRASRQAVDLRDPLRDRRLVELVRRMPDHQLRRGAWSRYAGRRAVTGLLPDSVVWGRDGSTLAPFFRKGLRECRRTVKGLLCREGATWHRYLRREAVRSVLASSGAEIPGECLTLTWLALSFETWRRATRATTSDFIDDFEARRRA